MKRAVRPDYLALARVRRSVRALNNVLARGAEAAGITPQQQAFLLALAAYERRDVLLADIREELGMDQATASEILSKLVANRLVVRDSARDRRAADIRFTAKGWATFLSSVDSIRREMQRAQHRAELTGLGPELDAYLRFYLGTRPVPAQVPISDTRVRASTARGRRPRQPKTG
jgi:DNA-binding MarR family transcriptional regulator